MEQEITIRDGKLCVKLVVHNKNAPTIVFLHDSLGCIELWRKFPEEVAAASACNYLVYDRHGYGKSGSLVSQERDNNYMEIEADILEELLASLQLNDVIHFGHSDGGSIALIHASKYPARIQGIISEGAHVFVEDITLEGIKNAENAFKTTALAERLAKYHGDKTESMFEAWAKTWQKPTFRDWNIESFLPGVTCPVLVIQGVDDEFGTAGQVEKIVKGVTGKSLGTLIEGAAHTPHREAKETTLGIVNDFISSINNKAKS